MWIEVNTSSFTIRSLSRIESSIVVAVPRHERDERVAAERELAQFGRRAVGDDVAGGDHVAHLHQRTLVDAGRTGSSAGTSSACRCRRPTCRPRHRPVARMTIRVASTWSTMPERRARDGGAGVTGDGLFHAGADERRLGTAPAARPDAACSSPSARGWRHRFPGTE